MSSRYNTKTVSRAKELAATGMNYEKLANHLNQEGHHSTNGGSFDKSMVSYMLLRNGFRRFYKRQPRRLPAIPPVRQAAPARNNAPDAIEVLRIIKACSDFQPSTKKALMQMVLEDSFRCDG